MQLRAQHSSNTSDVRKDGEREQQYRCTSKRSRIANGRRPRAAAHGGSRGTCTRESAQEHRTTTSHHQLSSSQSRPIDGPRERGAKSTPPARCAHPRRPRAASWQASNHKHLPVASPAHLPPAPTPAVESRLHNLHRSTIFPAGFLTHTLRHTQCHYYTRPLFMRSSARMIPVLMMQRIR